MGQSQLQAYPDGREAFEQQVLSWSREWPYASMLCPNGYASYPHGPFRSLCAVGSQAIPFEQSLQEQDWFFGVLSYEEKAAFHGLKSSKPCLLNFPKHAFFRAEVVLELHPEGYRLLKGRLPSLDALTLPAPSAVDWSPTHSSLDELAYRRHFEHIRNHILDGDFYELNYCAAFSKTYQGEVLPEKLFLDLMEQQPVPFGGFLKIDSTHLLCASPERFLKKEGRQVVSQPIKGTAPRHADPTLDQAQAQALFHSEKERSENRMIMDLVRNDLAYACQSGTVEVEELFGIYSFPSVHQMISSISGTLDPTVPLLDLLAYAFPMGSMTGAPKRSAMQHIDRYEAQARGWYSGALGYITPAHDVDFNVVIRSLCVDTAAQKCVWQAGGALLYESEPAQEYQELLLKARSIEGLFQSQKTIQE